MQLLTTSFPEGLPAPLVNEGVTHYTALAENTESLRTANVATARHVVIIAGESNDPRTDALTYDILSRIGEIQTNASIVVETVTTATGNATSTPAQRRLSARCAPIPRSWCAP